VTEAAKDYEVLFVSKRLVRVTIPAQPMAAAQATLTAIFRDDPRLARDQWEVDAGAADGDPDEGRMSFDAVRLLKTSVRGDALVRELSASAQAVLRELARTPGDTKHLHDRLMIVRGALRIGCEILEQQGGAAGTHAVKQTLAYVLTPLELCMALLEDLHPGALGKEHPAKAKGPTLADRLRDGLNGGAERFARLELGAAPAILTCQRCRETFPGGADGVDTETKRVDDTGWTCRACVNARNMPRRSG
jgi:hypothetical protein